MEVVFKSFCGDKDFAEKLLQVCKSLDVDTVIETGVYKGDTSSWFCDHFERVIGIEIDDRYIEDIRHATAGKKFELITGSSDEVIRRLHFKTRCLFFLDAHWYAHWPIFGELLSISEINLPVKPVILIHDCKVPGRPEFGFDTWNGIECSYDTLKVRIDQIYGDGNYTIQYPDQPHGAGRGALLIIPKYE